MTDDIKPEAKAKAAPKRRKRATPAKPPEKTGNKALWMGTAVGIGSAAIVAALLYTKRRTGDAEE